MSKHPSSVHRSHARALPVTIAPADLRRLRTRLHPGEHVTLHPQDVQTVLHMVDLLVPVAPVASARRPKPAYQRQQHRPVRRHTSYI